MHNPLAEYGIYLEFAGDYEIGEPPFNATNLLLNSGYVVQIRSLLDDEELCFDITTLAPNDDLILSPREVEDLDLASNYVNGDEPFYEKDAKILMLDVDELLDILTKIAAAKPVAKDNQLKAMVTKNCYVVNQGIIAKPKTYPITQFGNALFDPNTAAQTSNNAEAMAAAANEAAGQNWGEDAFVFRADS